MNNSNLLDFFKDNAEEHVMHSKRHCIEIMINHEAHEIVK